MGLSSLTSLVKMGKIAIAPIKRTSSLPPEQLVRNFLDKISPQARFNNYSSEARTEILALNLALSLQNSRHKSPVRLYLRNKKEG